MHELSIYSLREYFSVIKTQLPYQKNILMMGEFSESYINELEKLNNQVFFSRKKLSKDFDLILGNSILDFNDKDVRKYFLSFLEEHKSSEIIIIISAHHSCSKLEILEKIIYDVVKRNYLICSFEFLSNKQAPYDQKMYSLRLIEIPQLNKLVAQRPRIEYMDREGYMIKAASLIQHSEKVLDIGCGIRPQQYIKPRIHICADPFHQYIVKLQEMCQDNEKTSYLILNADWAKVLDTFPEKSVDTVFLLDVIEHLDKETGKELLKKTEAICRKQIVLFTPLGFIEQNHPDGKDAWGYDGGKWREHKSGWLPEDFDNTWEFLICKNFHTHDNLGNSYDDHKGAMWAFKDIKKTENSIKVDDKVKARQLNNKAEILINRYEDYVNAERLFIESILLNPFSGSPFNNLGFISYLKKDLNTAKILFEIAIQLEPENEVYHLNKSDIEQVMDSNPETFEIEEDKHTLLN